jgi:hypothetical protein
LWNIALKVPLGAFALVGRGQGHDPAHPGIQPLGDALDGAALAGGIAAFKHHDHLEALMLHPVLQAHQFMLQTEQLPKVDPAIKLLLHRPAWQVSEERVQPAFLDFHLQFLVETVSDFLLDTVEVGQGGEIGHGGASDVRAAACHRHATVL